MLIYSCRLFGWQGNYLLQLKRIKQMIVELSFSFLDIIALGILYSDLFMCQQMIVVEFKKLNSNYFLDMPWFLCNMLY